MLEALFNFILKLFFWLIGLIGSLIIYPVQVLIVSIIPDLGDFISLLLNFITVTVFPVLSFCKEAFLDITCCPRALFSIFLTFTFARWLLAPSIRAIKLIINLWKTVRGGSTAN